MSECLTRPGRLWCGTDYCETHAHGNSDRDGDKRDLKSCPTDAYGAEYEHDGYHKYPQAWPFDDVYRRVCVKKTIQPENWKLLCALGKQPYKYCPDGWCAKNSAYAKEYMKSYCSATDRLFGDPYCKEWFEKRPTEKEAAYVEKCNLLTNIGKPVCRTFCRNNPGKCDRIQIWCDLHPNDNLCGCYKSDLNKLDPPAPPASCFDNKCMQHGYMSKTMYDISNNCPNYIDCSQIIDISAPSVLQNVSVKQHCSIDETTNVTDEPASKPVVNSQNIDSDLLLNDEVHPIKKVYDQITAGEPIKTLADIIENNTPDTDLEIGNLKFNEIKLFVVLFIVIIFTIIVIQTETTQNNYNEYYDNPSENYYNYGYDVGYNVGYGVY